MLSNNQIVDRLENAFLPNACVANILVLDDIVQFKIAAHGSSRVFSFPRQKLSGIRSKKALERMIDLIKAHVEWRCDQ